MSAELTPNQRAGRTKRARTRSTVLAAAADLLEEVSYDTLTVAMIAERSGLSVATIHQVFHQKAAIVAEVFWEQYGEAREQVLRSGLPPADPGAAVARYIESVADIVARLPGVGRAMVRAYGCEALGNCVGDDAGERVNLERLVAPVLDLRSLLDQAMTAGHLSVRLALPGLAELVFYALVSLVADANPSRRQSPTAAASQIITWLNLPRT
jgi:AcrR family transcriptional regulator